MYNKAVVTLYEGHYHFGVGALLNSLVQAGFQGMVMVGYRGSLPPWLAPLPRQSEYYIVGDKIHLYFHEVDTPLHFGYYKPDFLQFCFTRFSEIEQVHYFDPDIVVNAPWVFFSDWTRTGVALCMDNCFPIVPANHPWRRAWVEIGQSVSEKISNVDYYVNSGYVGLQRNAIILLDRWIAITTAYKIKGGNINTFEKEGYRAFKGDQDLLNAAITVSADIAFSFIGKEGMGFSQPAYLMTHAVGDVKPWKLFFLKKLIMKGKKPDYLETNYFNYCISPIRLFSRYQLFLKRIDMKLAAILGRILA